jgi:hypothetical protein
MDIHTLTDDKLAELREEVLAEDRRRNRLRARTPRSLGGEVARLDYGERCPCGRRLVYDDSLPRDRVCVSCAEPPGKCGCSPLPGTPGSGSA